MAKVVVYSTPTCTYCHVVKIFLKKNKIAFEEVDISEDEKKRKWLEVKAGSSSVPVTSIGGKFVVGFDREKLKGLLEL